MGRNSKRWIARTLSMTTLVVSAVAVTSCVGVPTGIAPHGNGDSSGEGSDSPATIAIRGDADGKSDTGTGPSGPHGSASGEMGIVAEFFGQDGAAHAGLGCSTDGVADNIHIRISDLPPDRPIAGFEVEDYTGAGRWVDPCNDVNWFLVPLPAAAGVIDLYMKPHRDAPEGTPYLVTILFEDGRVAKVEVAGGLVLRDVAAGPTAEGDIALDFLGQDGAALAGEACIDGDAPDNIHIRVSDLDEDRGIAGYQVDDYVGGGRWVHPCNHRNWWLVPRQIEPGVANLYLKPHADSPDGTEYVVTVYYADGTHHRDTVVGTAVTRDLE